MKRKSIFRAFLSVSAVLAALLPVSCSNDDSGADSREIRLSESVATHGTRAISNQLPANGKVCVNIWDGGNAAGTGSRGTAIATDLYYTANGSGGLVRQNGSQPYFPSNGNGVQLEGYYPYDASLWSGQTFAVQTDQSTDAGYDNSDLLYVSGSYVRSSSALALGFAHKLSRISYELTAGVGMTSVADAVVTVLSAETKADFDFPGGTLTLLTGNKANVKPYVASVAGAPKPAGMAIVAPQTVAAGTQLLKIETGGKTFYYKVPAGGLTFTEGNDYKFNITVDMTGIVVTYSVSPWGTGTVDDGNPNANENYLTVSRDEILLDAREWIDMNSKTKFTVKTLLRSGGSIEVESAARGWLTIMLVDGTTTYHSVFDANTETEFYLDVRHNDTGAQRTGIITVTSGSVVKRIMVKQESVIKYYAGDYWPDPGVVYDPNSPGSVLSGTAAQGVVFWIDPASSADGGTTGSAGRIMSLDEGDPMYWGPWGVTVVGFSDWNDGLRNMKGAYETLGNSFDTALAFKWAHDRNPQGTTYQTGMTGAWYLPAEGEFGAISTTFNDYGRDAFNSLLTGAGGTALSDTKYWTSTEAYGHGISHNPYTNGSGAGFPSPKQYSVRAIMAF